MELFAFIRFGMKCFTDQEEESGKYTPNLFNPDEFN